MTSKKATHLFTVGQKVECLLNDFTARGFPRRWSPATVEEIVPCDKGRMDLVLRVDGKAGLHREMVGPHGGGKTIRPATT